MNINDMTNKDIAVLMAGRYVGENNNYLIDTGYAFHANEIILCQTPLIFQIPGNQILTSKQAYTALVGLCIDGYCKKIGPGMFVFTEDGIDRYRYLESVFGEEHDDSDDGIEDDDNDDDEVNAEPTWKTAYDAAMQAYNAAMNAYYAAMVHKW